MAANCAGVKSYKAWPDTEDAYLIQHQGQRTNRQMAQALGRTESAIENRLQVLRRAGIIPPAPREPDWCEADDRYLVAHHGRFTAAMLAEDLGRTPHAVNSRLRKLRRAGWDIRAMPRGRGRSRQAEQARAEYKVPELSTQAEREAMRDEVLAHIRFQVERQRLTAERATQMLERITQSVLQAPKHQFKRFCQKSVAQIVMEAA